MQMTRGWIEEAGEIAEAAKANLLLSIGRWKNEQYNLKKKILLTANPKKGWMKREFVDPFKAGILKPDRRFVSSLPTDKMRVSAEGYRETIIEEVSATLKEKDADKETPKAGLRLNVFASRRSHSLSKT